jgi:membrane protease YdiL (CAAX protease family)
MQEARQESGRVESYWEASRSVRYSFTFALPLAAMHELLAALLQTEVPGGGLGKGADALLRDAVGALVGPKGPVLFGVLILAAILLLAARDAWAQARPLRGRVFALMLLESLGLAALLSTFVGIVIAGLLEPTPVAPAPMDLGWPLTLMNALGAGIYEELLFRVVLVGALVQALRRILGDRSLAAPLVASLGGALIFASVHYFGPSGDPFDLRSFTFRAVGGLAFSVLYIARGFGITAWTHALYHLFCSS